MYGQNQNHAAQAAQQQARDPRAAQQRPAAAPYVDPEAFKKTRLGNALLTNNEQGYEVEWAFIDKPMEPKQRGQQPSFMLTVVVDDQQQQDILDAFEPYEEQIDAVFVHTGRKRDYFKPIKTKTKQLTGKVGFTIKNGYPVTVIDVNNNKIEPAPRIPKGSIVGIEMGILPFELNGVHGISTTRLYTIKVYEWGNSSGASGFGQATGEQAEIPEYARARPQDNHTQQGAYGAGAQHGYQPQQAYGAPAQQGGYQGGYQQPQQAYGAPAQQGGYQGGYQQPQQPQQAYAPQQPQQTYAAPAQQAATHQQYAPAQPANHGYAAPAQQATPVNPMNNGFGQPNATKPQAQAETLIPASPTIGGGGAPAAATAPAGRPPFGGASVNPDEVM